MRSPSSPRASSPASGRRRSASDCHAPESLLEARYDAEDPWGKARTKGAVLRKVGLELDIERPLVVFVGPLDEESGADLVADALPSLLKNDLTLIAAGRGNSTIAAKIRAIANERPELVVLLDEDDDEVARRLHAAA